MECKHSESVTEAGDNTSKHLYSSGLWNVRVLSLINLCLISMVLLLGAGTFSENAAKTVEAERFVLRDKEGKTRMELTIEDGTAVQSFYDAHGNAHLQLAVAADGSPALYLLDSEDEPRLCLEILQDGSATLTGYPKVDKKPRFSLSIDADGSIDQGYFDRDGKHRLGIRLPELNGTADIIVEDKDGKALFRAP
jgi:hypothetical protein